MRILLASVLLGLAVLSQTASPVFAQRVPTLGEYEIEQIIFTGGEYKEEPFRYLVLKPHGGYEDGVKYPLIFFLHGAGERGNDPKKLLPHFPTQMAKPAWREKFPCIVVVPQCRDEKQWVNVPWGDKESTPMAEKPSDDLAMAIAVLEKSLRTLPVDKDRVYLTGLSMGGFGAWELAMRRPELFAAVAPVCGGGDETQAARLKDIPIWTAHGDADTVVWPVRSQTMYYAIKEAGGNIRYTEYTGVGHNSWTQFYADAQGVVPWMLKQKRKNTGK